uniref:Uncharacterized protein n=1 Tax=Romanomermis culicivorax TaxID=13658 RepID=A0A915IF59_ROMCU
MAKLPPSVDVLAPPKQTATANLMATATQINDFLKLRLDDIWTLAPIRMDESTPVQPMVMDTKTNTPTRDQMLTTSRRKLLLTNLPLWMSHLRNLLQ